MNYLNCNRHVEMFRQNIIDEIYVDKSMLIHDVSLRIGKGSRKYICITRPRRFGKTMNANMLAAYYTRGYDSHEIFDHLNIAKTVDYTKHMNQYNVVHMDLSKMPENCQSYQQYIDSVLFNLQQDLFEYFHIDIYENKPISDMFNQTESSFIFILDEWDSIFYESYMTNEDKKRYLKFLKTLLKDNAYVELAYMTGVLPVSKYSSGSELNMFDEYNSINDDLYEDYFGFDENEVKELCKKFSKPSYQELQYWYNGYYKKDGTRLFNPRSVSYALSRGSCRSYWTSTGPFNEIAYFIEYNVDEVRDDIVKMVAGQEIDIVLNEYEAKDLRLQTREEILSAMVMYGFLSYYDGLLSIPNQELMERFNRLLERESFGEKDCQTLCMKQRFQEMKKQKSP